MNIKTYSFLVNLGLYFVTSLPLCVITFSIYSFGLKYKNWKIYDLFTLLLPGLIYSIIENIHYFHQHKSLSNIIEPAVIGLIFGICFFLRIFFSRIKPEKTQFFSISAMILMVVVTLCIYFLFPSLPE